MTSERVNLKLFLFECGEHRCLFFQFSMGFLGLLLGLEALLVDIIFEALGFELKFVVLSLKDSLSSPFFLNFLCMLNEKIVFLHFSKIALFSNFHKLGIKVRNTSLALIDIAT